jgi:hypothetical protein
MIFPFPMKKALNLSKIVSKLHFYSIEELALFDVEALCDILSDEQIAIENDDSFFQDSSWTWFRLLLFTI